MGNFTLGRYMPLDSVIHKIDPRAKIVAMLLMLIAIFFPAGWIGYGIIFAVAAGTILLAKLSFNFIWKSMKPMLFMMVFLFIMNCLVIWFIYLFRCNLTNFIYYRKTASYDYDYNMSYFNYKTS